MKFKKLRKVHAQKTSLHHIFDFERYTKQTTLFPKRKMAYDLKINTSLCKLRKLFLTHLSKRANKSFRKNELK